MSLIGHWPLNGNVNDISGNLNNGTAYNLTYTNGKIGQAAYFDGTVSPYIAIPNSAIQNLTDFTICFWIKSAGFSDRYALSVENIGTSNYILVGPEPTTRIYLAATPYTFYLSMNIDTWYHFAVKRQANILSVYLNGVLISSQTCITTSLTADGGIVIGQEQDSIFGGFSANQALYGSLNDFRIYNHALTIFEIQEVARAKILHYTFDDMQEPTTNLKYNPTANDWVNSGAWTRNADETDVPKPFPHASLTVWSGIVTTVGNIHFGFSTTTVSSSTTYTISVWYRQNRAGAAGPYMRTSVNNNSLGNFSYNGSTNSATWPINQWIRITATYTTQSNETGIFLSNYIGTVVGDKIWYYGYQVEQKDHVTDYVYGARTGLVRDHSGFFNDSVAIAEATTPKWIPEAKIGTGAYQFTSAKSQFIAVNNFAGKVTDKITVSAWAYRANWGDTASERIISCTETGGWCLAYNIPSTGYSAFYIYVNGGYTTPKYLTSSLAAGWHLFTGSYDGRYVKFYVDGVLRETIDKGAVYPIVYTTANNAMIGAEAGSSQTAPAGEYWNGSIDDVRIYATALSDTDILDLYQTRAQIEEAGVLYAKDFLADAEATANLIAGNANAYPTADNTHGTYSADGTGTFNNGAAYSIGNLISITDNIATFDGTGKALYTYDCIYPETTGGGLTAATNYFLKKQGTNQYSFHTYNSSQDGSQGYINGTTGGFQVHYSVDSDTRIAINATNFPTSWRGQPHMPNQSLVKQIVTNGFNYNGRVHDCLRLITSFRSPNPVNSYMAYGVYPKVKAGEYYTFSFYIRAVNMAAVGKIIQMTLYTGGGWSSGPLGKNYGYAHVVTSSWTRYEMTALAPNSGDTNMYFPGMTGWGDVDIAELQCEQKLYTTPFTPTIRPESSLPSTIVFGADEIHETGTANFEDFSTIGISDGLVAYWPLKNNAKDYSGNNFHGAVIGAISKGDYYSFNGSTDFIDVPYEVISTQNIRDFGLTMIAKVRPTSTKDSRVFSMKQATGYSDSATGGIGIDGNGLFQVISYDDGIAYKYTKSTTTVSLNNWHLLVGTYNPVDKTMRAYLDGIEEGTPQVITTYSRLIVNNETQIGDDSTQPREFAGDIEYVKVFNRALTAEEVAIEYNTMFKNQVQVHQSGILYAKDIIQY